MPANARLLRGALGTDTRHVEFADAKAWYVNPRHALRAYRKLVNRRCGAGAPWVRVLGETGWEGQSPAEVDAWVRYESLINLALAPAPATIVCLV